MIRKFVDAAERYRLTATAELSWHRGNAKPYFSLTGDGMDRGSGFGGCCHDEILKHWPDLAPLVALHLATIDGEPMHALENGFYHLGGTKWQGANMAHVASHFRISEDDARRLHAVIFAGNPPESFAKARLADWIEGQRARWLTEAEDAIQQFGLERPTHPTS